MEKMFNWSDNDDGSIEAQRHSKLYLPATAIAASFLREKDQCIRASNVCLVSHRQLAPISSGELRDIAWGLVAQPMRGHDDTLLF